MFTISTNDFDMSRIFARYVPTLFSYGYKTRMQTCKHSRFGVITTNETWLRNFDTETKRAFSMWKYRGSPACKKGFEMPGKTDADRHGMLLTYAVQTLMSDNYSKRVIKLSVKY